MATKSWIKDYFNKLVDNIANNHVSSERALSVIVEIPLPGWAKGKTLLEALEYEKNDVQPQYPIRVGTSKPKVDFMLGREPNRWMLDLKKPGDTCNRPKHIEQLQSYMSQEKVALGVLFNGEAAFAYANPEHPSLADILSQITQQDQEELPLLNLKRCAVREANMSAGDTREMCDFFRMFRCNGALPDIEELTRRLVREYTSKIQRDARIANRQKEIQEALFEVLSSPDEQVAKAISALRATPKDALQLWPAFSTVTEACPSVKRRGVSTRNQF